MRKDIVLCGVGGQGTVLASRLISSAAMARGEQVMSAETIGMAQRGGSVFSHLRIGNGIASPMIASGEADLILGFEPGEAVRVLPYLKKDGRMIVSSLPVMPVTAALGGSEYSAEDMLRYLREQVEHLMILPAGDALREVGSPKVLNLILLGAALSDGALGLEEQEMKEAIIRQVPEKFHELNFRALACGMRLGRELRT